MKTTSETEIENLEISAQSHWVERHFRETTRNSAETEEESRKIADDTKVTVDVFAVITNRSTTDKGVIKVASYSASDLYGYAQAPILDFSSEIKNLSEKLAEILKTADDDIEYEMETVYFWDRIKKLSRYLKISPNHDELISTFQQIYSAEKDHYLDRKKIIALAKAMRMILENIALSDDVLDKIYDGLEDEGFSISSVLHNMGDPS